MIATSDTIAQAISSSHASFAPAEVAQPSRKCSESDFVVISPNNNNITTTGNVVNNGGGGGLSFATSAAPPGYYESVPLSVMSSNDNNYTNTPNVNCSTTTNPNVGYNQSTNNDSICSSRLPHFTAVSITRENSSYASCNNANYKPQPTRSTSFVGANPLEPN